MKDRPPIPVAPLRVAQHVGRPAFADNDLTIDRVLLLRKVLADAPSRAFRWHSYGLKNESCDRNLACHNARCRARWAALGQVLIARRPGIRMVASVPCQTDRAVRRCMS